jgi:hypothetical protein
VTAVTGNPSIVKPGKVTLGDMEGIIFIETLHLDAAGLEVICYLPSGISLKLGSVVGSFIRRGLLPRGIEIGGILGNGRQFDSTTCNHEKGEGFNHMG